MPDQKISKVKLSNGQVYSFFDNDALHLHEGDTLVVGNAVIDNLIINEHLSILEINDMSIEEFLDEHSYVVTYNELSKQLKKRSSNNFLADIGGYSAKVEDNVLSLKLGKQ